MVFSIPLQAACMHVCIALGVDAGSSYNQPHPSCTVKWWCSRSRHTLVHLFAVHHHPFSTITTITTSTLVRTIDPHKRPATRRYSVGRYRLPYMPTVPGYSIVETAFPILPHSRPNQHLSAYKHTYIHDTYHLDRETLVHDIPVRTGKAQKIKK